MRIAYASDTARAVAGSLAAAVATQLALMVSGIAVARMLGVDDRGHLALFTLLAAILALLGSLGLPVSVTYFLAQGETVSGIAHELRRLLIAQFTILAPLYTFVLFLVFRHAEPSVRNAAWLSIPALPAALVQAYAVSVVQGQRRFRALNFVRPLPALVYGLGIAIAFVVGWTTLWQVTAIWVIAAMLVAALSLSVALYRRERRARGPRVHRRDMLRFGLKGMLGATSPLEAFRLDQAVVGLLLSPHLLGLYVVGIALTNFPRFIGQSLGYIAYPLTASRSSRAETRVTITRFVVAGSLLSLTAVVTLEILAGRLVPLFFGDAFRPATGVTHLLLISAFFASMRKLLSDCAQGAGYPSYGSLAEIASWVVLVPSLVVLTPALGINGVALSMALAYGASCAGLATQLALALRPESRTPFRSRSEVVSEHPLHELARTAT